MSARNAKKRTRSGLPPWRPKFPVTKSEPPQYSWEAPIPMMLSGKVEFRVLYVAMKAAGLDFHFDERTQTLLISPRKEERQGEAP